MTTVEYKSADYTIGPSSTQQFTFWWGAGSYGPVEYFDVTCWPDPQPDHPSQLPLVEVQRAFFWDGSQPGNPRSVLLLTLRNDNDFEVYFTANHIRIYDEPKTIL
jgi:hypothetical protein